jgi:penicillin amidase
MSASAPRAPRPPWRTTAAVLVGVAIVGVFAAREAAQRRALRRTLPTVEGRFSVAGLDASLTILRDGHGVPHVLAASQRDAWFGLGFAQAQDRLAGHGDAVLASGWRARSHSDPGR